MSQCTACDREDAGVAYVGPACARRTTEQLHTIADLADAARDAAYGLVRYGATGRRTDVDAPLPGNLTASTVLDECTSAVTTWARHVADERGMPLPPAVRAVDGRTAPDPASGMAEAAQWLTGHLEWIRHQPWAAELVDEIGDVERRIVRLADRPGSRRYLGTCGAIPKVETTAPGDGEPTYVDGEPCTADLYAYVDARQATCRTCGTVADVADRRAWLDQVAREHSYTAAEIAHAYGIPAATIRTWAHRTEITSDGERNGRATYPLGLVLDLARHKALERARRNSRQKRLPTAQSVVPEGHNGGTPATAATAPGHGQPDGRRLT